MQHYKSIEAQDFAKILTNDDVRAQYQLVDVREPHEIAATHYKEQNFILNLPLSLSNTWIADVESGKLLDPLKPMVVMCRSGRRSATACAIFTDQLGFKDVYNLEGGILQYAIDVDPTIDR